MLSFNIGSGKLSSCMLSIGLGPKCEQGKGGIVVESRPQQAAQTNVNIISSEANLLSSLQASGSFQQTSAIPVQINDLVTRSRINPTN